MLHESKDLIFTVLASNDEIQFIFQIHDVHKN